MPTPLRWLLFGGLHTHSIVSDLCLTLMRIGAGLMMAIGHGWGKFPPPERFIEGVGALGFPAPTLFAWLAAFSEFIGGLLVAAGFLTRPMALMLIGTMAVAAFGAHADDPLFASSGERSKEMALLYLIIMAAIFGTGSGRLGIDAFLRHPKHRADG